MRGLLLKDVYAIRSYFRVFLVMEVLFILISAFADGGAFLIYYACILSGTLIASLVSYEEKERWSIFAGTLPVSRAQIVSEKYILNLILNGCTIALVLISRTVSLIIQSSFDAVTLIDLLYILVPIAIVPTALILPFVYKLGAEKGRIAYYCIVGVTCALVVIFLKLDTAPVLNIKPLGAVIVGISAVLFAVSWFISVKVFRYR